mgnify:CR=1 FL=1
MAVINISGYKFIALDDLATLKPALTAWGKTLNLKGTILLASEGINIFLAGVRSAIDAFMAYLHRDARFADLQFKESISDVSPFKRLRVRLKKEIITMKQPMVRPEAARAPSVDAPTLKRWLDAGCDDAGRPVLMLDTRNDYEVAAGSFRQAIDFDIACFSEFPKQLLHHQSDLAGKTVVSFCTGGIRCEKAALLMRENGVQHVYQLEGGILKYFEQVGDAHYQGTCFVFDGRGALDAALKPASSQEFC